MKARKRKLMPNLGPVERILSLVGGSALLFWAFARPGRRNAAQVLGGAYLLYRGISGRDPVYRALGIGRRPGGKGIDVIQAVTIARPREEVYSFWRDFENLPKVMDHLEEVRIIDGRRSHWKARAPLRLRVEWEAEVTEDRPNELIAWRSLRGSPVQTSGLVRFSDAPEGFGTEVLVHLTYQPPFSSAGAAVARLFGEEPRQQIRDGLRRLKQILETGQVPTLYGQTSARIAQVRREREDMQRNGGRRVAAHGGGES